MKQNRQNSISFELKILAFFVLILFLVLIFAVFNLYFKNENLSNLARNLYEQNVALNAQNSELLINNKEISSRLNKTNDKVANLQILATMNELKNQIKDEKHAKIEIENNLQNDFLRFIPNGLPVPFNGITSEFGERIHPVLGYKREHFGIDLRAKVGTPVIATADGFVEYSANSGTGYGFLVILTHNYGFKTKYAHLYNQAVVFAGQFVKKGQVIAYSGNTGLSTGPHLHYEVLFLERNVDPYNFLSWDRVNFMNIFQNERKIPWQGVATAISQK